MSTTLDRNGWMVADYYVLATVLLGGALRGMSWVGQPSRRLAMAGSALAGLALLAVLVALPGWPRTGPFGAVARATPGSVNRGGRPFSGPLKHGGVPASTVAADFAQLPAQGPAGAIGPVQAAQPRPAGWPGWSAVGGGAFLAGTAAVLGWIGLGAWEAGRLRRRTRPAPAALVGLLEEVAGPKGLRPELRVGPVVRQPLALGVWRPAIILPATLAAEGPTLGLRVVLAHELAHVRHGDLRTIALLRLLLPLLYAHPAYWWLRRRVRDDQEAVADAAAAGLGDRLDYAEVLLSWSRRFASPAPLALGGAVALFERPSQLRWRIGLLLDRKLSVETACPRAWRLTARLVAAGAVLGLSLLTTSPVAEAQDEPRAIPPTAAPAAPPAPFVDDVPLRGRILNIQGEPVVGATVRVIDILESPTGGLDEWLARLARDREAYPVQYDMLKSSGPDPKRLPTPATTDRDGRFSIAGIGRERIATLLVGGPGIATTCEYAATRAMPPQKYPSFLRQPASHDVIYHGNGFDLVGGPDLVAVGTITDADTGKPVAGVRVETAALFGNPMQTLSTTTDAVGRYRLAGIAPRTDFDDDQQLLVTVADSAYVPAIQTLKPTGAGVPTPLDFRIKLGVEVRGRVVDGATGAGVKAALEYYIDGDNPSLATYPRYGTIRAGSPYRTDDAGNFRMTVLPGRGAIGARAWDQRYLLGQGMVTLTWAKATGPATGLYDTRPHLLIPTNYHTLVGIDPTAGSGPLACEIQLDSGRTIRGTVIGPDGRPLAGAWIEGLEPLYRGWTSEPLSTAEFTVQGLATGEARDLVVVHEGQKLAAALVVRADEAGPVTVRLGPSGAATGRILDGDGRPMAGVQLTASNGPDPEHRIGSFRQPVRTDVEGRFRVEGLPAGRKLRLLIWLEGTESGRRDGLSEVSHDAEVEAGGTIDLGNLIAK